MFYDRFESLCDDKGVTTVQAANDLGIRRSTISMWKSRKSTPGTETLNSMSHYFGISVDKLLNDACSNRFEFYRLFEQLCANKSVRPAQVSRELGISQSTMASWKSRKLRPNAETLERLSLYFGVTMAFLLGKEEVLEINKTPLSEYSSDELLQEISRRIKASEAPA